MSCLRLRLPPPKKAWKILTSKLWRKLPKLHRPRPVYKFLKTEVLTTVSSSAANGAVFVVKQPRRQHRQRPQRIQVSSVFKVRHHGFKKQQAHVFVNEPFKEPLKGIIEHHCPETLVVKYMPSSKSIIATVDCSAPEAGKIDEDHDEGGAKTCEVDDMWESVGLASPLTRM